MTSQVSSVDSSLPASLKSNIKTNVPACARWRDAYHIISYLLTPIPTENEMIENFILPPTPTHVAIHVGRLDIMIMAILWLWVVYQKFSIYSWGRLFVSKLNPEKGNSSFVGNTIMLKTNFFSIPRQEEQDTWIDRMQQNIMNSIYELKIVPSSSA